jgi:putative redox protein
LKARIKLVDGMAFMAESGSGHAVIVDGAPDIGGRNLGARPMELVLMGSGACTAIDVVMILRKARQPITDCEVLVEADRAGEDPKVFTRIHLHYVVTGKGLATPQVERAIKLSKDKYCSATIMLAKTAEVTFDYEIREG